MLDPGRGKTKTGQLWAYARDDRPWQGIDPPGVAYVYAPDHKAERPMAHLEGFIGVLQVDGYSGYRPLAAKNTVSLAFYWSHVRQRFYELAAAGPAPIATEALRRIAELYKIEDEIRGLTQEERCAARQEKSRPITDSLAPWLREQLGLISQKTNLAEAIRYALSRWDGLIRFIDDGRIEIDSNTVERSIRPIALNRENALFAGSDAGAGHWATIASLIETAKLDGVEPLAYLADVPTKIVNGHSNSQIEDLLPWAYVVPRQTKAVAWERRLRCSPRDRRNALSDANRSGPRAFERRYRHREPLQLQSCGFRKGSAAVMIPEHTLRYENLITRGRRA